MFLYRATLNRVVSTVTISVNVDLGFGLQFTTPVRLNGVSLPETPEDKAKAVAIIDDWVNKHPVFVLQTFKNKEKFGRYLGTLMDRHGGTLNQALLESHVVQPVPEGEIPDDETEDEVESEHVAPEELPDVVEVENGAGTTDLLENDDDVDLVDETEKATKTRRRWRLKKKTLV